MVNGLNQPLPLVRFQQLVQKAAEVVQEVESLGNSPTELSGYRDKQSSGW